MAKDKAGFQMIEFYLDNWLAYKKLIMIGWIWKPIEVNRLKYTRNWPKNTSKLLQKIEHLLLKK